MRIGGIASGMDTDQMVRDLMRAERTRMNRFLRQEQTLKWRQEAYNDVNRIMANFILNTRKDFGITQVSSNGTMRPSTTNNFNWVKEATSSDTSVVSATARSNAMNGNHKVEVEQLASNATVSSNKLIGNENSEDDLLNENLTFKELGVITVKTGDGKNVDIEIKDNTTINDVITALNNSDLGVRAAFDRNLGQVMISTRETGSESTIEIASGSISDKMFNREGTPEVVVTGKEIKGTNAKIHFNGTPMENKTNNFSVFGIDLNLRAVGEVNINVDTNVDGIFNEIKSFVDSYNEMLDSLNGKVNEKHYRDFHPLTQEEKDSMSEKDIELWEAKAKSGLLRNDEVLTRTVSGVRNDLYKDVENVSGSYKHITDVGITTGNYRDGGKLVINEDKLRDAISKDPEGVMDLFFKVPDSSMTGETRTKNSGIVQRVYDGLTTGMKDVVRRSGTGEDAALLRTVQSNMLLDFVTNNGSISVLDRDLTGLNSRIAREEQLLTQKEDRYWRQFTAMEKALSQMNQQSMWLMSQMGM